MTAMLSLVGSISGARADEAALTRTRVGEIVKAAPAARVATSEVGVARAVVGVAGMLSQENPVISAMGGVRVNQDRSKPAAVQANLSWPVDLGGRRSSRIEAAQADQRAAEATAGDVQRRLLLAALLQHALVIRDERQLALIAERRALADRLVAAAERSRRSGNAREVEVTLAQMQARREAAAEEAGRGARDADRFTLLAQLGLEGPDTLVTGELVPPGEPPSPAAALGEIDQRTDVRAANMAVAAARARALREQAARWPTIGIIAQYERDDSGNIGMIGLSLPLPILNANRVAAAAAVAEVDVAASRADVSRTNARGQIRQLYSRYEGTKKALDALRPAATLAMQTVALAARTYELGEGDLQSVLVVRREAVDALTALLDAEHAHANAKIELLVTLGRMPR